MVVGVGSEDVWPVILSVSVIPTSISKLDSNVMLRVLRQ
jgi:hypothetical protein